MASPYGLLGLASAAETGVRGAALLDELLRARRASRRADEELNLRREQLDLQRRTQELANALTLLDRGDPSEVQRLRPGSNLRTAVDLEVERAYRTPPQSLEAALTRLLSEGDERRLSTALDVARTLRASPPDAKEQFRHSVLQKLRFKQPFTPEEQAFFQTDMLGLSAHRGDPTKQILASVLEKRARGEELGPGEQQLFDAWYQSQTGDARTQAALMSALAALTNAQTNQQRAAEAAGAERRRTFAEQARAINQQISEARNRAKTAFTDLPGKLGEEARARALRTLISEVSSIYDREIELEPDPVVKDTLTKLKEAELRRLRLSAGLAAFFSDLGERRSAAPAPAPAGPRLEGPRLEGLIDPRDQLLEPGPRLEGPIDPRDQLPEPGPRLEGPIDPRDQLPEPHAVAPARAVTDQAALDDARVREERRVSRMSRGERDAYQQFVARLRRVRPGSDMRLYSEAMVVAALHHLFGPDVRLHDIIHDDEKLAQLIDLLES